MEKENVLRVNVNAMRNILVLIVNSSNAVAHLTMTLMFVMDTVIVLPLKIVNVMKDTEETCVMNMFVMEEIPTIQKSVMQEETAKLLTNANATKDTMEICVNLPRALDSLHVLDMEIVWIMMCVVAMLIGKARDVILLLVLELLQALQTFAKAMENVLITILVPVTRTGMDSVVTTILGCPALERNLLKAVH